MNETFAIAKEKIAMNKIPNIRIGDVIKIHRRVKEGEKERTQILEGVVIARKHGSEPGSTLTIRRLASGVFVEMVFPIYSPQTEKIEVVKRQKVRRAKLYYLRGLEGKKARLKENIEGTKIVRKEEMRIKEEEKKAEKEKNEAEKTTKEE